MNISLRHLGALDSVIPLMKLSTEVMGRERTLPANISSIQSIIKANDNTITNH